MSKTAFDFWQSVHTSPYHFLMDEAAWEKSMYEDIDSDGKVLFDEIHTEIAEHGVIQYGITAFGFDESGEISDQIHYAVIRDLWFDPAHPDDGKILLKKAMRFFGKQTRVYAFFHYFGMSACARHGKLHESQGHIHDFLLRNGFCVEHENVYYSRVLTGDEVGSDISVCWRDKNPGDCRDFVALDHGKEICWGQVHFLPQESIAYLRWIYIDGSLQHQGYGSRVMGSLCQDLYAMGIRQFDTDTARDNLAAQGYYEKTGFTNRGITRSYHTK